MLYTLCPAIFPTRFFSTPTIKYGPAVERKGVVRYAIKRSHTTYAHALVTNLPTDELFQLMRTPFDFERLSGRCFCLETKSMEKNGFMFDFTPTY